MFEDIVGQNVEVIVSFSSYSHEGGANPIIYYGTLLESTAERSVVNITSFAHTLYPPLVGSNMYKKQGKVFINNNYIVSMSITP